MDRDRILQFGRFVLAGLLNTAITYAGFMLLTQRLGTLVSYTIVYVFGIALSYLLNVLFVFRRTISARTAVAYPAIYVIQYLWGVTLLHLLTDLLKVPSEIGILAVIATSLPLTFVLAKLIVDR